MKQVESVPINISLTRLLRSAQLFSELTRPETIILIMTLRKIGFSA